MKMCYEFHTKIGPFRIVRHNGRYHAVFSGISIGCRDRADDAAAMLGKGYRCRGVGANLDAIDTTELGIPVDLNHWIRCYFTPDEIKQNFACSSSIEA